MLTRTAIKRQIALTGPVVTISGTEDVVEGVVEGEPKQKRPRRGRTTKVKQEDHTNYLKVWATKSLKKEFKEQAGQRYFLFKKVFSGEQCRSIADLIPADSGLNTIHVYSVINN